MTEVGDYYFCNAPECVTASCRGNDDQVEQNIMAFHRRENARVKTRVKTTLLWFFAVNFLIPLITGIVAVIIALFR